MADSKFLKWQDKTGDGIPDVCDDLIPAAQIDSCDLCKPLPTALVPDWKTRDVTTPFVNERECLYQITIVTNLTTTGAKPGANPTAANEALQEIYTLHASDAMAGLLLFYNKKDNSETRATLVQGLYPDDYYLDFRPTSKLQLLYSVPTAVVDSLPEADAEDEETENDESSPNPATASIATYDISELFDKIMTVRKGLNLYNRYFLASRFLEGTNIFFEESNKVFNLEDYGDAGFGNVRRGNIMADILPQLESFLNTKNIKIPGIGLPGFQDAATKITFYFDKKHKLIQLDVYTEGCGGEIPLVYKKSLSLLQAKSAFANPTAMAYLAQLDGMIQDLTARSPLAWLEFIQKYTVPTLYVKDGSTIETSATPGNCVQEALKKEAKEFGQDLLDETFGLADAIAYKFHRNLCYKDQAKVLEEHQNFGFFTVGDPDSPDFKENLLAVAQERAYKQVDKTSGGLCAKIGRFADKNAPAGSSQKTLDDMWEEVVQDIKVCGLNDLLMGAVKCLFKGMSLEDALSKMISAALKGMSVPEFGQLFLLLPQDKQDELNELVKQKINSGDIFREGSARQTASDQTSGALNWDPRDPATGAVVPWRDQEYIKQKESSKAAPSQPPQRSRRTLAKTLDSSVIAQGITRGGKPLDQNKVMDAYILALLELYQGYYLELIDLLNDFPGAELIAKVIATLDCPRPPPPGKESNGYDFIKNDTELPYCFNIDDITLPRLENPFGWLPQKKDFIGLLMQAAETAIQEAVMRAMVKLFLKICQTVSAAACKGIELLGDLAQAPFSDETLKDLVKETFCGPDSNDDTVNEALLELVASLGPGAIALADQQKALRFASDLSSATTRREFTNGFIGNASDTLIEITNNLIDSNYPEYREGLGNKDAIGAFFKNIGNAMPLAQREQMRDYANGLDEDDPFPANPNLCATPDQLAEFCEIRSALLGDRATEEQKAKLCLPPEMDLADVLQQGPSQFLGGSLPPILSDPGCDNGLLPFEPAEAVQTTTTVLNNNLEMLKIDFLTDMLGNGPFESDWGMLNLILADTRGNPLTTHHRKREWDFGWQQNYVDFYVDSEGNFWDPYASPAGQRGAYPVKVAQWLSAQMDNLKATVDSNNVLQPTKTESIVDFPSFGRDVNLLEQLDYGYNIKTSADFEREQIRFVALARKKTPDTILSFKNNNGGEYEEGGEVDEDEWNFGLDFEIYMADLVKSNRGLFEVASSWQQAGDGTHNRPDDNMRIKIMENTKKSPLSSFKAASMLSPLSARSLISSLPFSTEVQSELKYEFLAVDNTFDDIDLLVYPNFVRTFTSHNQYSPPVVLLHEMIKQQGAGTSISSVKSFYDSALADLFNTLSSTIAANDEAFDYGATFDNLTDEDLEYVIDSGTVPGYSGGTPYDEVKISDPDALLGERKLKNSDQILGISAYQWKTKEGEPGYTKNRVHYLDPNKFGGSFQSPPLYIEPPRDKGWFGLVDVIFPDQGACKPMRRDLVDFGDIQDRVTETYDYIPEDERLKIDRDCALELPYNRILERPAVAGLESVITSAIRIYVSMHFIKSLATFTTIKPDFSKNFSSAYASYIIEDMEESFKDAQGSFAEAFTLFKDEEFWYAFLEQAVQLYARRVDGQQMQGDDQKGGTDILEPPQNVLQALHSINDMQEEYKYPTKKDLWAAKKSDDAGLFQTLGGYRQDKNLEAVQATEEQAKIVLKELVVEQLEIMGERFMNNVGAIDLNPRIHNLAYYLLENLSDGSSLTLDGKEIKEEVAGLPLEGEELYTNGGELVTADGDDYVGFYHVHINEDGIPVYMEGEFHIPTSHGILTPIANRIIVPIGDVADYNSTTNRTKPFTIEKYISIKGIKYAPADALTIIAQNEPTDNISDVYPGSLKHVVEPSGKIVGLEGKLGVRYGLELSVNISGTKTPVATSEIDVLDLPIDQMQTLGGDSKTLLCLVNQLIEEDKFKLIYRYIFSLPKIASTLAIYNDMSFLPSIGQITVPISISEDWPPSDKPGKYVSDAEESALSNAQIGWNPEYTRSHAGFFVLTWDEWDKTLMLNSKSRIKHIFKAYYNSAGGMKEILDAIQNRDRASWTWFKNLKSRMKPSAGAGLLPWWKKRKLRSNPFDMKGNLCDKK